MATSTNHSAAWKAQQQLANNMRDAMRGDASDAMWRLDALRLRFRTLARAVAQTAPALNKAQLAAIDAIDALEKALFEVDETLTLWREKLNSTGPTAKAADVFDKPLKASATPATRKRGNSRDKRA